MSADRYKMLLEAIDTSDEPGRIKRMRHEMEMLWFSASQEERNAMQEAMAEHDARPTA